MSKRKSDARLVLPMLVCARCGWKWIPRQEERPAACPRCKRFDWDKTPDAKKEQKS
jgi:predicted Zn-ribbon and HTH transcriptional regulator